jgi:hypothetical protein
MFSKSIVDISHSSAMLGHHWTKSNGPQTRQGGERMALYHASVGEGCMLEEERTVSVLEPCARANRGGLPWRKFEWHILLGKNQLRQYA